MGLEEAYETFEFVKESADTPEQDFAHLREACIYQSSHLPDAVNSKTSELRTLYVCRGSGHIGVVHSERMLGAVIAILKGSTAPLVLGLRPNPALKHSDRNIRKKLASNHGNALLQKEKSSSDCGPPLLCLEDTVDDAHVPIWRDEERLL